MITTTPSSEFDFAYMEPDDKDLPVLNLGRSDGRDLGSRMKRKRKVHWRQFLDASALTTAINAGLESCGMRYRMEQEEVESFGIEGIMLICITMPSLRLPKTVRNNNTHTLMQIQATCVS